MASISGDEAFARYANEHGFATLDQLESARQLQAEKARNNIAATLAEILVSQGILTPALRENIEKKLQAQQQGGIKQLGNYKLIKKLGEGGMGAVYLAEDTIAERKVALKVLPRKLAGEGEFLTRFRREAKAAGKLNHVNIVTAFSVGEEMGHHFYVMEYCEGEPLDKLLKRQHFLPWDRATEIIIQVARGLEHAHKHGFLHRDIKPANVFMTKDGTAKILDLGLSKNIADAEQSFQTQSGVALGTPHYISPEQAQGERNVDGRTDIYSLGASYYHLLTGQTPFKATTAAAVIMKHLTEQLPNPQDIRSEIPDEVVHVIERMMAKSPLDRYADCAELLADLELVAQGKAPSSHALEPAKSTIMPSMKRNSVASAVDHMRPVRKAPQPPPLVPTKRLEESVPRLERRPAPKKNTPFLPIAFAGVVVLAIVIGLLLSRSKPPATSVKPEAGTAGTGSAAVSTSSDKGGGLLGEYYSNMDLSGTPATRVDPELDFNWGDGSPMSGIPSERFSVRWTGFVTAAHSEVYTFSTTSDDGVRLWVDDRLLIDHWRTSNSEDRSEKIQLKAGQRHRIRLEFFDEIGLAIIKLQWSSPSTPKQIIPRERLTPSAAPMRAPPVSQAPPPPLTQPAPAAAASAIFPSTPAERWKEALDLLALIDLEKDTVNGTWTRSAEGLTPPASGIGDKQKVEIPYQPPSEYDLRISFTPRDHGCDLTPILARNGRQFSFKLWGRDGATTTGFEIINGQSILENSTMKTIERFTPGRRYTAVIEVRDAGLRAFLDGKLVAQHATNYSDMSIWSGWQIVNRNVLGLGNAGDPVTFHAVHLLEISARGRPIRAAAPKEPRRVNLLPLINPVRDAVVGTWTMREGSLVSDSTGEFPPQGRGGARLQIPYKPPEEYDLRVSFTRLSGLHCVAVLFPMNGETLTFIAGGYDNRLAGFEMVNGHGSRVGQNPTTVHRNGWLTNQRQELVLQVRKRQARVLLDGSEIMRSPDNYAGMSTAVWYRLNDGALPGIGSWASPMAFHVIELTEISGTGSPVR